MSLNSQIKVGKTVSLLLWPPRSHFIQVTLKDKMHLLPRRHSSSLTTAAPVTMSEEVEGKLISLAADILIDNLVQVNNIKVNQTLMFLQM